MAILLAVLFALPLSTQAQARSLPIKNCLNALKWQRWNYTKAHINVTNSLQQHSPKRVHWSIPTERNCVLYLHHAKALQLAENSHWSSLRLRPPGVKWIIIRQFHSAGKFAVRNALQVASCESNFDPYSHSPTGDSGVWQINWVHHVPKFIMESPELSTAWAWRASDHGTNFSPTWVCATLRGIN